MSLFYKKFLSDIPSNPADLTLFALGKHPGWNDHVEGMGIHNETLALFNSVFYVNGIRSVIDSGVWERTDPIKVLPGFNNLVLWQARKSFLAFRMWPSRDGKGRAKYPMIAGVFGGGIPLLQAVPLLLPFLEKLETSCRETKTEPELRAVIDEAGQRIRPSLGTLSGGEIIPPLEAEDFQEWMPALAENGEEGWVRILYTMSNQLSGFCRGQFNPRSSGRCDGEHIRLPLSTENGTSDLLSWLRFMRSEVDGQVPLFLSMTHGRSWSDLIVGEPDPSDFGCLRLNEEGMPPASAIPFNIPEAYKDHAVAVLRQWRASGMGKQPGLVLGGNKASGNSGAGGWFKRLLGS